MATTSSKGVDEGPTASSLSLFAETTLGCVRLDPSLLPAGSVAEYISGVRNAATRSDQSFLASLQLGYSFQLYVGAVLLANGFWTHLHPLSTRPNAAAGRAGSHSDKYDLLAGVQGRDDWGDDQYSEVQRRILRLAGPDPSLRVAVEGPHCPCEEVRPLSFSIEVKARGQAFDNAGDFPFMDLILEPESRFAKRTTVPDLWAAVSQSTGAIAWFPSVALASTFVIEIRGRKYRTAPTKHFFTTQQLGDYLSLRGNDDLVPHDT